MASPTPADPFTASIAKAVSAELRRYGHHGSDLAPVLGFSRNTVSKRLKGERPFTPEELRKVAVFLGITLEDIWASAELGMKAGAR